MTEPNQMHKTISLKRKQQRGFSIVELLIVLLVGSSIAAMTIPALLNLERNYRSAGDARSINGAISMAKMRAAATFTKSRIYADTSANTLRVQIWCKAVGAGCTAANTWTTEGGITTLSTGVRYGYGSIATPPTNTQTTLGQAGACQTDAQTIASTAGNVANSACVMFNSRGIPIDDIGAPTGQDALYVTDGSSVYGATISGTGLIKLWRSDKGAANWKQR